MIETILKIIFVNFGIKGFNYYNFKILKLYCVYHISINIYDVFLYFRI